MYSDDYEYAHSRLAETIVRIDDRAVFVHKVSKGMKVSFHYLEDEAAVVKVCLIGKLNLKPVPLGYCNFHNQCTYLTRYPMRRDWRQGLRHGNFGGIGGDIDSRMIPYHVIALTIQGNYPTFEEAVNLIGKVSSVAWHRSWAIDRAGNVHYKGDKRVGRIVNGEVELDSKYEYLTEALKESL